jgi:hypothetical protein
MTNHNSFVVYNFKLILKCFEYCKTSVLKIISHSISKLIGMSKSKALILNPFFGSLWLLSKLFPQSKEICEVVY